MTGFFVGFILCFVIGTIVVVARSRLVKPMERCNLNHPPGIGD